MTSRGWLSREEKQEWRRDWKVAVAGMVGFGATTLHATTISIYIKPIMADTGWSLSTVIFGITICSVAAVLGTGPVGWLLDRVGARKLAIWGTIGFLISYAAVGVIAASALLWWIAWLILGVVADFSKSRVWAFAVVKRFDKSRGLALGLMGCGLGLFGVFMPYLTQVFIDALGWRMAFVAVAAVTFLISAPFIFAVYGRRDFDAVNDARAAARTLAGGVPGPGWRTVIRTRHFWQLLLAGFMVGGGVLGVQYHLAPMLQEKGLSPQAVALVLGSLGVSAIVGRFVTGFLLDRFSARMIGAIAFLLPAAACLLYLQFEASLPAAVAVVLLFGFAAGAETDVLAFVTARYLGLRSYGFSYSFLTALLSLGGGLGPLIMSRLHEADGDYYGASKLLIGVLVAGSVLLALLGPIPKFATAARAEERQPA